MSHSVKKAQLSWLISPPSVLPCRYSLLNEREFTWEQRIAEDPNTACGACLLSVCTCDCCCVKVQQICSQIAWLSLRPWNPQVSPPPVGKSSLRSKHHDWVIKLSGQSSQNWQKEKHKTERKYLRKKLFSEWKTLDFIRCQKLAPWISYCS